MFKSQIERDLKKVVEQLGFKSTDTVIYISENVLFGDYTTNIALQLSKQKSKKNYQPSKQSANEADNPREIANDLVEAFGHPSYLERIDIAGPGFINFFIKDTSLVKELEVKEEKDKGPKKGDKIELPKRYLIEYADPNTHKAFHIGHLRTLVTGESISRILNYAGNEVFRANYGSDIGPTVAKCLWAITQMQDEYKAAKTASLKDKAEFLGRAYVHGNTEYEDDPKVKEQIDLITTKLYQRDPDLLGVWEETKKWSLGYFETIYSRFGTEFDLRVNESEVDEVGKETVMQHVGSVFEEDQGAIIFRGEKYGLHTRVFISAKGNPLYEAKEVGLVVKYEEVFPFDELYTLSDARQESFFEVANKAISLIHPHVAGRKHHFTYGTIDLTTGKMSSRKGNIVTADELVDLVVNEIKESYGSDKHIEKIAVAAIKFYFLKYALSSNILLDLKQAVALHGDSGPYLLYTYARINSILEKSLTVKAEAKTTITDLESEEREVLRQLDYFDPIVERAATDLSPNDLAAYLLNLAKSFNQFYEKHPVLGSKKQDFRLKLATKVGEQLKLGCYLLGFEVLEKM